MTNEEKVRAARALLEAPFAEYGLTDREQEAVRLLVLGYDVDEIARRTSMGKKTSYRALESVALKVRARHSYSRLEWHGLSQLAHMRLLAVLR